MKTRFMLWATSLLVFVTDSSQGIDFTKVTGQGSPGVVINDEAFRCWFSPIGYSVPSGSTTSVSDIRYDVVGRVVSYDADVDRGGIRYVDTQVSAAQYNGFGQITGFSESRRFVQTGKRYSIRVSGAVYSTRGKVTSFSASVTVRGGANYAPTDLRLSKSNVQENQPPGTAVGTLSTTDPQAMTLNCWRRVPYR